MNTGLTNWRLILIVFHLGFIRYGIDRWSEGHRKFHKVLMDEIKNLQEKLNDIDRLPDSIDRTIESTIEENTQDDD